MLRTTLLLGAMTGLIMGIGQYFGGSQGLTISFIFAVVMNFGSYWFSDKIVLKMYDGQQVSEADAPQLYRIVHALIVTAAKPTKNCRPLCHIRHHHDYSSQGRSNRADEDVTIFDMG